MVEQSAKYPIDHCSDTDCASLESVLGCALPVWKIANKAVGLSGSPSQSGVPPALRRPLVTGGGTGYWHAEWHVRSCPVCHRPAAGGSGAPSGAPCRVDREPGTDAGAPGGWSAWLCPGSMVDGLRPGARSRLVLDLCRTDDGRVGGGSSGLAHDGRATSKGRCSVGATSAAT